MATAQAIPRDVGAREPDPFVMWGRLRAIIIDSLIVAVLTHFALVGFSTFQIRIQLPQGQGSESLLGTQSVDPVLFGISVGAILYFLYFILFETLTAATPGKIIAGLRVVDRWGDPASPWQALVRDLVRPIDAAGAYLLGGLVARWSQQRQRIGDRLAGTMVVSVESMADPEAAPRQVRRASVIVVVLLALVLVSTGASALIPPRVAVASYGTGNFYPVNGVVTGFGAPDAREMRVIRIGLLSYSPGHASYAIHLRLIDSRHRISSCAIHLSFVWANPLTGWRQDSVSSVCQRDSSSSGKV